LLEVKSRMFWDCRQA